jgi:drug/metabolite transporter (DMT)-like permease
MPALAIVSTGLLGLLAATLAAFLWSIATVLWRRVGRIMPPVRINLVKGITATIMLGGVVAWQAARDDHNPLALPPGLLAIMIASGVIGLAGGDTCFFAALNRLGARRTLLMFMLAPVLTALLAWPVLGQSLSLLQGLGIVLTCGGIAWVIAERTTGPADGQVDALGLTFAIGAAVCQAIGSLMSRHVFDQVDYGAAPSALVRIIAGTVAVAFLLPLDKHLREPVTHGEPPAATLNTWLTLAVAVLLGTVFGIWLQQTSFKLSDNVGVASTLLATSPLFVLPITAAMGERVSIRAITGAMIGVLGIAILMGALG